MNRNQSTVISAPDSCKVYTPKPIADSMVSAVGGNRSALWLEPCLGRGVFIQSLAEAGFTKDKIVALDLDRAKQKEDSRAQTFRGVETLSWLIKTDNKFDRIIGNPPFIPLHAVHSDIQRAALRTSIPWTDDTVPLGANLWFAFLCGSLSVLRPGGAIAFILPASWEFADYAANLRSIIPTKFARLFTLRCQKSFFDGVQDGSVILIGLGYKATHQATARVECESLADMCNILEEIGASNNVTLDCTSYETYDEKKLSGKTLGDFLDIRIGGVTGDARYFILKDSERRNLNLPRSAFVPVLSRSRHVKMAEVNNKSWQDLLDQDERVLLFHPTSRVLNNTDVKKYLRLSIDDGGCNRTGFKIGNRNPWYITPLPKQVDGFLSGMSQLPPVITFRNMPRLNATNTLYTVRFRKTLSENDRYSIALALLSSPVISQVARNVRRYASGLKKLEPSDLTSLKLPTLKTTPNARKIYCDYVKEAISGHYDKIIDKVDAICRI